MKRAEERVDRAAVFLMATGERDVIGRVAADRMVFRCRPGGIRNFAEPFMSVRLGPVPGPGPVSGGRVPEL